MEKLTKELKSKLLVLDKKYTTLKKKLLTGNSTFVKSDYNELSETLSEIQNISRILSDNEMTIKEMIYIKYNDLINYEEENNKK